MKVRVVQAETSGRSSFSLSRRSRIKQWPAATEGGRQRLRAKTIWGCGFVKSSADAKENTFDMAATAEYGTHMLNGNVRRWWWWRRLRTGLEDRTRDGGRRAEARWRGGGPERQRMTPEMAT